jgi:hypothetical protein
MRVLSFIILIYVSLIADDIKITQLSNSINIQSIDIINPTDILDRISVGSKACMGNENVEVDYDIELYRFSSIPGKFENISLPFAKKSDIQINSLYSKISTDETKYGGLSIYYGIIPFKGGRFSEIKNPNINGGNGLAIINNQVYSSLFLAYSSNNTSYIFGKSSFSETNHYNGLLDKNDGSSGKYTIITHEYGKHFFEVDYYSMNIKMGDIDYAGLDIGGFGYIYDDSLNSGYTFYMNFGISHCSEDIISLLHSYNIPDTYLPTLQKKGATVSNTNNTGYALLLGGNYEFDNIYTYNTGIEVFITKGGWVSANHGVLFQSDHSWWNTRDGIETILYAGVNFTKNLRLQTKFTNIDSKSVPNNYSISTNSSQSTAYQGNLYYTHIQTITIDLNYKF